MTVFDPERLLDVAAEEELSADFTPCPEGEWQAVIERVEARVITSQKDGSEYPVLDVRFRVTGLPEDIREELGLSEPTVRGSIFLRLTPDGRLDPRGNQPLARLFRAAGLPSTSPIRALEGAGPLIVRVRHRTSESGEVFADAVAWRPIE